MENVKMYLQATLEVVKLHKTIFVYHIGHYNIICSLLFVLLAFAFNRSIYIDGNTDVSGNNTEFIVAPLS